MEPIPRAYYLCAALLSVVLTLLFSHYTTSPSPSSNEILQLYTQMYPSAARSPHTMRPGRAAPRPPRAHLQPHPPRATLPRVPRRSTACKQGLGAACTQAQLDMDTGDLTASREPLLRFPLTWFELPWHLLGGDYVLIPLHIGNQGPLNFLVDTGLTTNLLTPMICDELGIIPQDNGVRGMGGDGNINVMTTTVSNVSIAGQVPVPKFTAAVVDFPQRKYAERGGMDIHGMVGMEFLEQFDLKYDEDIVEVFPANSGLELQLEDPSWSLVKGIMMPARLMAVQITVDDHPEPFLGLVDSGASHSIMNHAAAKALGYNLNSKKFKDGPGVNGFGIMGKQKHMPTVSIKVCLSSFDDNIMLRKNWLGRWWLTPMDNRPEEAVCFEHEAVVAIGDMNFNSLTRLTERGLGSYKGPLILTGQDILTQRNIVFNGQGKRMAFGSSTGRKTNA